ncbi:hypothetical protein [Pseudomonas chlororaphis]|uniref:Uncharacterized protein n=1 Tax=Pseudomonas chlororaphis TaxID=587753 RepID=A0A1Q8EQ81_9PSED|nr:hypothetical protein [Pseudomonas chlororaphis]OLF53954.1 hypothetical protein BTN82_12910 [Pseudomonas chlororaphis]
MNFKSTVMPGVRAFASTMRVKPCAERAAASRVGTLYSTPSSPTRARANWRVCPVTCQLQQRWSFDDSQDPQSRSLAALLMQAGLLLSLSRGSHF